MHTVNLLKHLVEGHEVLAYAVIFLGIVFEGEFIIISTGILAFVGALNIYSAFIFILCGGIGKTFLGYYIGNVIEKKWKHTKFVKYLERRVSHVMPRFEERSFWSIFISKFILGINNIIIIFSGFKKVPLRIYLKAEFISTLIWAPSFFFLGYFFGFTALNISHEIWRFLLIVLMLVISFIAFDRLIAWLYEVFEEFFNGNE
ncbi:MAG: hypothetical protein NTW62_00440 [Candidatus Nomurabacteria bacterium]|nr:hypothetical protein [Candidatus Nomurabacteria bacterium]